MLALSVRFEPESPLEPCTSTWKGGGGVTRHRPGRSTIEAQHRKRYLIENLGSLDYYRITTTCLLTSTLVKE